MAIPCEIMANDLYLVLNPKIKLQLTSVVEIWILFQSVIFVINSILWMSDILAKHDQCVQLSFILFRRFQEAKEYADELEKVFRSLLEIRTVSNMSRHSICDCTQEDASVHVLLVKADVGMNMLI